MKKQKKLIQCDFRHNKKFIKAYQNDKPDLMCRYYLVLAVSWVIIGFIGINL